MNTPEKNKAIVRRFNKEFVEDGKTSVFHEIVDPQLTYHAHPQGIPEGREAFWNFFQQTLRPSLSDIRVDLKDTVAEDDKVVTLKAYSGFIKTGEQREGTEERIEWVVMEIIRLRNGRFIEVWNLTDSEDAGMQAVLEETYIY